MSPSILITTPVPPAVRQRAAKEFNATFAEKFLTTEELIAEAARVKAEALFVVLKQKFTAEVIAKLPESVKIIATCSVGYDHFDLAAAKARGITLTNTPDVLTECTADLAMLLLLNACRRGREYQEIMNEGWKQGYNLSQMLGQKVSGRTLGIFGMGRIGQAVADRARGFGMKVLYCNRRRLSPDLEKGATYFAKLEDMLPHCQILSLNAPGGTETFKIMNRERFALMPAGSVLVNVARGSLVDEEALMANLKSGHLFAAGLDVFQSEPDFNKELLKYPTVFMTPHMGSATEETRNAMGFRALDNIAAVLQGRKAEDSLTDAGTF